MLTAEDKEEIKRIVIDILAKTGESSVVELNAGADAIVDVTARAIEVFGTRDKALHWLKTPVRSLGDRTPLSLLNTPEGITEVHDKLGRVEHGIW
jgi:putative toxin-antitoxin system antitoxin component (TIGR02293 family)